jgi:hypothetical protein
MSEVDRLSNSGMYPALPLGDQRRREGAPQQQRRGTSAGKAYPQANPLPMDGPRPPKSLIDEYA